MIAWFAIAIALALAVRWAGYRYGWWDRVGAWLAVELEYEETTREKVAVQLASQVESLPPAEPKKEKRPVRLGRLRKRGEVVTLSFSDPELRKRWRR